MTILLDRAMWGNGQLVWLKARIFSIWGSIILGALILERNSVVQSVAIWFIIMGTTYVFWRRRVEDRMLDDGTRGKILCIVSKLVEQGVKYIGQRLLHDCALRGCHRM